MGVGDATTTGTIGANRGTLIPWAVVAAGFIVVFALGRHSASHGPPPTSIIRPSARDPVPATITPTTAPATARPGQPRVGDPVTLACSEIDPMPVANRLLYYAGYNRVLESGDVAGLREARDRGEIGLVPRGTAALLVHVYEPGQLAGHTVARVRIRGGLRDGKEAYLPATWLVSDR